MNKKYIWWLIFILLLILLLIFAFLKINKNDNEKNNNKDNSVMDIVKIKINDDEYELKLSNNETAKEFLKLLPLNIDMQELNGNEKYYYLNDTLPSNPQKMGKIEKGDVMLYGDDCIVIFYKTFNTAYSYTKIGYIDGLNELSSENITVLITE